MPLTSTTVDARADTRPARERGPGSKHDAQQRQVFRVAELLPETGDGRIATPTNYAKLRTWQKELQ